MAPLSGIRDRLLIGSLAAATGMTASIVVLILVSLILDSRPALQGIGFVRFFTDDGWLPGDGGPGGSFGLLPMLLASVASTLGAVLLAGPLGILSGLFVVYYAPPRVAFLYRRIVEVLAGMPSVVWGFWGLVTLVPIIRSLRAPGPSLLAGILILAIMILPTIAVLSAAAFSQVPRKHLRGAAALGLSRWTTLTRVVWPSVRAGLGAAILLGTMRAIGETMAILMVSGNVPQFSLDLFQPVRTLTANIALELGYATAAHRAVLSVSGLFLMLLVLTLVLCHRRLQAAGDEDLLARRPRTGRRGGP